MAPGGAKEGSLWAGPPVRTSRRLGRGRRLAYALAAPLLRRTMELVWRWCRDVRVDVADEARRLLDGDSPLIACFWHQRLLFCLRQLLQREKRTPRWCVLVSPSVDGELATKVLAGWKVRVVRGSATRTGVQAIRELYRVATRERLSLLVAPDGPHGPARRAKAGAVVLGQLSGAPLLPMSFAATRGWRLGSWDRLLIPKPFARIALVVGDPIRLPRDMPSGEIQPATRRLEAALEELEGRARAMLERAP